MKSTAAVGALAALALVGFLTANCCSLADEACDANCQPISTAPTARKRA